MEINPQAKLGGGMTLLFNRVVYFKPTAVHQDRVDFATVRLCGGRAINMVQLSLLPRIFK
jgi:hypothetical protein